MNFRTMGAPLAAPNVSAFNASYRTAEPLWQANERAGGTSLLLRYTCTWPPTLTRGVQVEGHRGECSQLGSPKPGPEGDPVEYRPVGAGQSAEGGATGPGRGEQPTHLVRGELATPAALVEPHISGLQPGERRPLDAAVVGQPLGELADRLEPVVDRLDTCPLISHSD